MNWDPLDLIIIFDYSNNSQDTYEPLYQNLLPARTMLKAKAKSDTWLSNPSVGPKAK